MEQKMKEITGGKVTKILAIAHYTYQHMVAIKLLASQIKQELGLSS